MSLLDAFAECGGEEEGTWAADSPAEIEKFRLLRHAVPEGINAAIDEVRQKEDSVTKLAADFSAPLDRREELIALYREGIQKSGLRGVYFGHIAENHLHVNLIPRDETQYKQGLALLSSWAGACASMGGCLAAENGIGKLKRNLLDQNLPQEQKALMAAIKAYFDPAACSAPATSYNENRKEALLLKIAVCIKQVPATQDAKMDPDKGVLLPGTAPPRGSIPTTCLPSRPPCA